MTCEINTETNFFCENKYNFIIKVSNLLLKQLMAYRIYPVTAKEEFLVRRKQ